ncbi:tripartite tricarboxylate transporter substrate binding protein [Mesorhizobium sp. B2-2-3]|uniref:Bug family tripartite tricarboxylate transporter substrate binding protein n=1 Tax=Mesorhizobium sp. B2-2-3 TaxID=2589963 RepID=UPI00112CAB1B|nr:tripartite tricarboxylate transporter substrate binding protein [Mesorhizobium sp. B2-2-3]TPM40425.1 tripartite tricarboxylate transporter substrate binding protein [Mesorhizobium sp. B2-2-3]
MGSNDKTEIDAINRSRPTRRSVILGSAAALALFSSAGALAEQWPSRPIELIVPFAPGGGTDLLARALADELSKQFDVPVQVVNRAGGGGVVGFEDIRAAKPDGYTLGILTAQLITANLRGVMKTSYKDFAPVAMLTIDYAGLSVQTNSKWKTLPEFLDAAKADPGSITVGNGSQGGSFHMLARNLEEAAGVKFKHVPFDGGPAAIVQLLGGHIDSTVNGVTETLPYIQSGQLRMLAVAGTKRYPELPDVATSAELGYPLDIATWRGVGMPKDTPAEIVSKVSDAVASAVKSEDFLDSMKKIGANVEYMNSPDLTAYLAKQEEVYKKIF